MVPVVVVAVLMIVVSVPPAAAAGILVAEVADDVSSEGRLSAAIFVHLRHSALCTS